MDGVSRLRIENEEKSRRSTSMIINGNTERDLKIRITHKDSVLLFPLGHQPHSYAFTRCHFEILGLEILTALSSPPMVFFFSQHVFQVWVSKGGVIFFF